MANRNYRRGVWVETQVVMILTSVGYWAERSHASKGLFDVRALSDHDALLITCRRSKPKIVSDRALLNANRDTVMKLALLPSPPATSKEFWHYQDRQKGQQSGTWRRYRIEGDIVTPVAMPPIPRGRTQKAAEKQVRVVRDRLRACESIDMDIKSVAGRHKIHFTV